MPEKIKPNSHVVYICDACGIGEMDYTGIGNYTCPIQYEHECSECGIKTHFSGVHYLHGKKVEEGGIEIVSYKGVADVD